MTKTKKPDPPFLTANVLTAQAIGYLTLCGCFVWRNNTGSYKPDEKRFLRFGKKGSGDIIGMTRDGRFLSVEVKVGRDRVSKTQLEFMDEVIERGGLALVIHNFDDLTARIEPT